MFSTSHDEPVEQAFSHALAVCGPSAAGKTTFIETMVKGRLGSELMAHLPDNADRWPTLLENDIRKRRIRLNPVERDDGNGVIFHYDTFFIHRTGRSDYVQDTISPFLLAPGSLTIVDIRPSVERLKEQYDRRLKRQALEMGLLRSLWKQRCVKSVKRLRYRVSGKGWPYTRDLYERPGTIEECYRSWDGFLSHLLRARTKTCLLDVTPEGDDRTSQHFKLQSFQDVTNGRAEKANSPP